MAYIRTARLVAPHMARRGGGRIINIGGMTARIAAPLRVTNGIVNAGVANLTTQLSAPLAADNITINCIHPGITRTERTPDLLTVRASRRGVTAEQVEAADYAPGSTRGNALGRMIDAAEIADLAAFLCSDRAWAITGEVVAADGGGGTSVYY